MHKVIVSTAGTSLLTSWRQINNHLNPSVDDLVSYLESGSSVCAEANSLSKLDINNKYDYLYFVSSDTPDGRLCVEALEKYYTANSYSYVMGTYVSGLNKNYYDFQSRGLMNLFKTLSAIYQDHPGMHYIINATGGFKAQTSFATLFGIITGIEVVYLHEDFSNLLRFPLMPVSCNRGLIEQHKDTFAKITGTESKREAREYINSLPESLRGFFHKVDNRYSYSPVGLLFIDFLKTFSNHRVYTVRTYKNHTSLWGDGINNIEDISDPEVRSIFYRIFDCSESVTAIFLDEMVNSQSREVYFEYLETVNHALRYKVHTPRGSEHIKVEVFPGHEREVLQRIGRRIYP